jgi:hypothetical protein
MKILLYSRRRGERERRQAIWTLLLVVSHGFDYSDYSKFMMTQSDYSHDNAATETVAPGVANSGYGVCNCLFYTTGRNR